jgi:hypothetical protein
MHSSSFFGVLGLLSVAPYAFAAVDAALEHHPVKSIDALRKEVLRWRDEHHSRFSDADCERLVGWLNRNFYRLEK